ncbi:hypothetical protein CH63R_10980 [Colletotrichum higginsianum IMI 349063]|uniref:Uncharacterized protein n=1 Tax=Colletotrichum higginsianum (strain IMI 349063) TaxID=759273 RepID=A0A1B7Y492_COLHI|nr:uncharacterized protein CH63R_10980 [Colletotrichum higginsianum IMI 349063]OBR06860.1 hypothetical protein CH63R_10980 [Colletotrichum higginsianum IMI 349063]
MAQACLPRLLLLFLSAFFLSAAVVTASAAAAAESEGKGQWARRIDGGDYRSPAEHQRRRAGHGLVHDVLVHRAQPPTPASDSNKPARLEDRVVLTEPTPAALFGGSVLEARQGFDNPEEAINSASRSAQQAIAAASQSAREAVQQANDQVRQAQDRQRQAEDQARQANEAATRASASANNAVAQAQASARQDIAQAQDAARESASRQIAENLARVTASASTQLASQVASVQASAASAIAAATQSASAAVQNAQQQAQQQIQAARDDANIRIQQAQGTAVSVTQAALAVVGAIIGSSLLTILGFYLFTRYRRNKRRDQAATAAARGFGREISYPRQDTLVTTNGLALLNGYSQDVKRSMSPTRPETARTTASGKMGYALSNFGDGAPNFSRMTTFVGSTTAPPPPPTTSSSSSSAASFKTGGMGAPPGSMSVTRRPVPASPMKPPALSLFPPRSRDGSPPGSGGTLPPTPAPARDREPSVVSISPSTSHGVPVNNDKLGTVDEEETDEFGEGSKNWLRRTQTVSPFGHLADSPTEEKDPGWPFMRSASPPPPARLR